MIAFQLQVFASRSRKKTGDCSLGRRARCEMLCGEETKSGNPYWPIVGLPLSEWQAALTVIEKVLPQIDNRLIEVRLQKDGSLVVRTGELMGGLNGHGHQLLLRNGEGEWKVEEIVEWAS
jgi:hypothetical protein